MNLECILQRVLRDVKYGLYDEGERTMNDPATKFNDGIALSEEAADLLLDDRDDSAEAKYEPDNVEEANAAVKRLSRRFDGLPGKISNSLESARNSGSMLSSDRLQCLSEVVQNADDARASQVRILLRSTDLLVSHDGDPVRLHHVLGFALPWLSTKVGDSDTIGRYGIGLMTIRALSTTMEVHCHPYHVRFGAPIISSIDQPILPAGFGEVGWTTLRIPLDTATVSLDEIREWLNKWDDAALLFLRHVTRVTLLASDKEPIHELALRRFSKEEVVAAEPCGIPSVSCHRAESSDGRSWFVYSADAVTPTGVSRSRKATGPTTPVSVALPLGSVRGGEIYAGLPVAPARLPLYASAQFDPLASRRGFADNRWNRALVPLVVELWSLAAIDLFRRNPKIAWLVMPIAEVVDRRRDGLLIQALERSIVDRARSWLAPRLLFHVPEQGHLNLSELAVEMLPLEGIITEAEVAKLADLPAALPSGVRDNAGFWRVVLEDWRSAGADLPEPVSVERALDLLSDGTRSVESTITLSAVALDAGLSECLLEIPCVIAHDERRLVPPSEDSPEAVAVQSTRLAQQLGVVTLLHSIYSSDDENAAKLLKWLDKSGALLDSSDDRAVVHRLAAAGKAGRQLKASLSDEQIRALRDAFQRIDPALLQSVGLEVGQAISLSCYSYDGDGIRRFSARPIDAYLPGRIESVTNSFAAAAERTQGPVWLSDEYATVLRSPRGREGIGAQRFLRLLGAETAPRIHPHPNLIQQYSRDSRKGLNIWVNQGPEARRRVMLERDATYTLQDAHSPDLQAVVVDISHESQGDLRRRRALALLSALGRAWDRFLVDFAVVSRRVV